MTYIVLNDVGNLQDTTTAQQTINNNNKSVVSALSSSVPITGTTMAGNIDMNSNHITNLPPPSTAEEPLRLTDFNASLVGNFSFEVAAGTGLTVVSTTPTLISIADTGVTSGTYGSTSQIPSFVVNPQGQLTSATNLNIGAKPLTVTSDTNVTLSLSGSSSTALFQSVGLSAGFTGTLASSRLNSNVVQSVTSDTNITGSITSQALSLGFTGTMASSRLNNNVVQSVTAGQNMSASITSQALTMAFSGQLPLTSMTNGSATNQVLISGASSPSFSATPTVTSIGLAGTTSGSVTLKPSSQSGAAVNVTVPNASGTLLSTAMAVVTVNGSNFAFSSTTPLMAGQAFTFTPKYSNRGYVNMVATFGDNGVTTANNALFYLYYGTGSAPTSGGATTGISITVLTPSVAGLNVLPISLSAALSTFTPGTTYWFDIACASASAVSSIMYNPAFVAFEI